MALYLATILTVLVLLVALAVWAHWPPSRSVGHHHDWSGWGKLTGRDRGGVGAVFNGVSPAAYQDRVCGLCGFVDRRDVP